MLKYHLKFIFLLCIVANIAYSQRGGGSGGGGSSFGGSSSFGGRSSFGGSSYTRNYGNSGYYGGGSGGIVGTIIGIILFGICGVVAFIIFCCSCGCCCLANSSQNQYNNLVTDNSQFQRQRQKHNNVNSNNITHQQFQLKLNQFVDLINGTSNSSTSFIYTQGIITYPINSATVTIERQQNFIYKVQLRGTDELGSWLGKGYFLNSHLGVTVWWMKDYYDKNLAGQTGQWSHLVYQSTQSNYSDWNGIWYFVGFQGNNQYSGTWNLSIKQLPIQPNYFQQNPASINSNQYNYNNPPQFFNNNANQLNHMLY